MAVMDIAKADNPMHDSYVRSQLSTVRKRGAEGAAELEIALIELALMDLHQNKEKVLSGAKVRPKNPGEVQKFHRALAKAALETGNFSKALELQAVWKASARDTPGKRQWIERYDRQGNSISAHWRALRAGEEQTPETKRKEAELKSIESYGPMSGESSGSSQFAIDAVDDSKGAKAKAAASVGKDVLSTVGTSAQNGAIRQFLEGSSLGEGILNVMNFVGRTGGTLAFAARSIYHYGPAVGLQMAKNYYRYGGYDVKMEVGADGRVRTEFGDVLPKDATAAEMRTWAIDRLHSRLPNQAADDAGAEPPSEGFIINAKGEVLAHGVGRGKDHFLPFSSRHLNRMRKEEGVEYVRRRMFGGPTSEDIHTAMMMGADRLTVVSNGGVFTLDVSHRSHGIKLEHMQVVGRFEEILKRRGRDFDGYNQAMRALEAEFPLHFRVGHTERGDWANREDRITPVESFMESIRDVLGIVLGDDTPEQKTNFAPQTTRRPGDPGWRPGQGGQPQQSERVKRQRQKLGIPPDMTMKEAWEREVASRPNVRAAAQSWRDRLGDDTPQNIIDVIEGKVTPGGQQKATPVAPPGGVPTQRTDRPYDPTATTPTPKSAQPSASDMSTVDWSQHEDGRQILEVVGVDPEGFVDAKAANEILEMIEHNSGYWKTAAEDYGSNRYNMLLDRIQNGYSVDHLRGI